MGKAILSCDNLQDKESKVNKYQYLWARSNWPKLGEDVVRHIADSFDKADEQLFVEFVDLSERNNMLKHNYLKIKEGEDATDIIILMIAVTLERKGTQFSERYASSNDIKYLDSAISLYRSSITLDENFIAGYFQLSVVLAVKGQVKESKKFFELGKKVYSQLRDSTTDLDAYKNAMLQQFSPELIEEFERNLTFLYSE